MKRKGKKKKNIKKNNDILREAGKYKLMQEQIEVYTQTKIDIVIIQSAGLTDEGRKILRELKQKMTRREDER